MPIVGLTTRKNVLPPFIGKLHKGSEGKPGTTKSGKTFAGYGDDLDHFRFTPYRYNPKDNREQSEAESQLASDFATAYPHTRRLEVFFPSDDVEVVFEAFCEEWDASKLVHRCDGEYIYERNNITGEYQRTNEPCPYATNPNLRTQQNPGCKQIGRLMVVLPELLEYGHFGTVTIETHSKNDIAHIQAVLDDFKARYGRLMSVPFYVYRQEEKISTPNGSGGRVRRDKWLVKIQAASEYVKYQLQAARQHALSGGSQAALPAPKVDYETGEILEGETINVGITAQEVEQNAENLWGMDFPPYLEKAIQVFTRGKHTYPEQLDEVNRAKFNDVLKAKLAHQQQP